MQQDKQYEWVLFDADETLFHFDAFLGLQTAFIQFNASFSADDFQQYQQVNQALWLAYQNNTITAEQLQTERLIPWATQLGVKPRELNDAFINAMAILCQPLEGAIELLQALHGTVKLGIITNGFSAMQQARLERTGIKHHFEFIVVSEEVGIAKPHPAIFDHAMALMGNPPRERILMVGDNLEADILGGLHAGMHTCWLNTKNQPLPTHIKPHYEINTLSALSPLILPFLLNQDGLHKKTL